MSTVTVRPDGKAVRVTVRKTPVHIERRPTNVIAGSAMGMQGPPGQQEGATFSAVAGGVIHGHHIVKVVDGVAFEVDPGDRADMGLATGIATGSALVGEPVTVRTDGYEDELSWNWSPGPIYAGMTGQLTQTQPTSGWCMEVARAVLPTRIIVDLQIGTWRGN